MNVPEGYWGAKDFWHEVLKRSAFSPVPWARPQCTFPGCAWIVLNDKRSQWRAGGRLLQQAAAPFKLINVLQLRCEYLHLLHKLGLLSWSVPCKSGNQDLQILNAGSLGCYPQQHSCLLLNPIKEQLNALELGKLSWLANWTRVSVAMLLRMLVQLNALYHCDTCCISTWTIWLMTNRVAPSLLTCDGTYWIFNYCPHFKYIWGSLAVFTFILTFLFIFLYCRNSIFG